MTGTQKSTEYTKKINTVHHEIATKSIGKYKISNNILNNKQIQEAKKLKRIAKHEYQQKIKTKNGILIQTALTQYVETQKNLRTTIFFFFYPGFLSRTFTIHGTAGEG